MEPGPFWLGQLGALSHPFLGWEGSHTKIGYRKKGTLILTFLLEDLVGDVTRQS